MAKRQPRIECTRCEKIRSPSKTDGGFCQECFDFIEDHYNNLMDKTRAAACYINQVDGRRDTKLEVAAFLNLFHPEMSDERVREILREVKDD